MDSSSVKEAVMRQVQLESNTANVRVLMEVCSVLPVAPGKLCCAG